MVLPASRNVLLTLLVFAGCVSLRAQPGVTSGLLNVQGFPSGFVSSADQSLLAFYNIGPDGARTFVVFNLRDFSSRTVPALRADAHLHPESGRQFYTEPIRSYNGDSTRSNIRLHYSGDGTTTAEKIYEDRWIPFDFTADGKLIVADGGARATGEAFSLRNLRIVDPESGNELRTLWPGPLLTVPEVNTGAWAQRFRFILQPSTGSLMRINRQSGQAVLFQPGAAAQRFTVSAAVCKLEDTLLICDQPRTADPGSGRIVAYGLRSGRRLIDSPYAAAAFAGVQAWGSGRRWAMHAGSGGGLTEYALTEGSLERVQFHKLDMELVPAYPPASQQSLVVSRAANRVMLLPDWNNGRALVCNEAFIWELSSGKLLHVITGFFNYRCANAGVSARLKQALDLRGSGVVTSEIRPIDEKADAALPASVF